MLIIGYFRMTSDDGCLHYFMGTRSAILEDVPRLERAWDITLRDLIEIDGDEILKLDLRQDERDMLAVIEREKTVEPLAVHLFSRDIGP